MNTDDNTHQDNDIEDESVDNDNDNDDTDDSDSDHQIPKRPMSKLRASRAAARRETSRFTFLKTLEAVKAKNDITAAQRKTPAPVSSEVSSESPDVTHPPVDGRAAPPHMMGMRQGTLVFDMTSTTGAKRKGKELEKASLSSPSADAPRPSSKPARGATTPLRPHKRTKVLQANPKPTSSTEKAAKYLKDMGMIETTKVDLKLITNVLFKVAARVQDTGTSETIHALASLQEEILRQQEITQATNILREAAKEISNNLTAKLAELTKETVTAVRQGVSQASRELDKCTDVVKVVAGDFKATAGSTPRSYARAAAPQDQGTSTPPTLLHPTTQARMERDRRRILVDPPTGQASLYPATTNSNSVTKKATEALHGIGGDTAWVFVSCTKLEKGGILLETNRAEAKSWLLNDKRLDAFIAKFSPGATVKPKKYTIKALYLPVDQPIDTAEAWRIVETENDLPPNAISHIKWMKPASRRGKDQQHGHATITLVEPSDANKLLRQGLQTLGNNYRCHKSKVEPLRCLKCQHYGHIASTCKAPEAICATCAQHHEDAQDCPQLNRKEAHACVSCNLGGHASWNRTCPSRQKLQRILDERLESNTLPYFPTDEPWTQRQSPFYSGRHSKQDLTNCNWRQAKKDQLQQTTIPDAFRPLIESSRSRNSKGKGVPTVDAMEWSAIRWDLPADDIMNSLKEKSPPAVAS